MKARKRRPRFNPHYPQHGVKVIGQAHPFNVEDFESELEEEKKRRS